MDNRNQIFIKIREDAIFILTKYLVKMFLNYMFHNCSFLSIFLQSDTGFISFQDKTGSSDYQWPDSGIYVVILIIINVCSKTLVITMASKNIIAFTLVTATPQMRKIFCSSPLSSRWSIPAPPSGTGQTTRRPGDMFPAW